MFTPPNKEFTAADLCAYRGIEPSKPGVGDHVIPHCIFEFESHSEIRVPACERCNGQKSKDEGFVRDWLCSHADIDLSAVSQTVYEAFMGSANELNKRRKPRYGHHRPHRQGLHQGRAQAIQRAHVVVQPGSVHRP